MNGEERIISGTLPGGERLDKALSLASGLSRERIKALMGEGRVMLGDKAAAQASLKPDLGTAFTIRVPEAAPAVEPVTVPAKKPPAKKAGKNFVWVFAGLAVAVGGLVTWLFLSFF